mgnify:CR=1 FL=1
MAFPFCYLRMGRQPCGRIFHLMSVVAFTLSYLRNVELLAGWLCCSAVSACSEHQSTTAAVPWGIVSLQCYAVCDLRVLCTMRSRSSQAKSIHTVLLVDLPPKSFGSERLPESNGRLFDAQVLNCKYLQSTESTRRWWLGSKHSRSGIEAGCPFALLYPGCRTPAKLFTKINSLSACAIADFVVIQARRG